jgi:hypothetical protein
MKKNFLLLVFTMLLAFRLAAQTGIFPGGSSWKYLDNGPGLEPAWQAPTINAGSWKTGNGKSGYDANQEAPIINFGPDIKNPISIHQHKNSGIVVLPASNTTQAVEMLAIVGLPQGPQLFPGRGRGGGPEAKEVVTTGDFMAFSNPFSSPAALSIGGKYIPGGV